MKIKFEEWIKNFSEEEVEEIKEKLQDWRYSKARVKMGYRNDEDVILEYYEEAVPLWAIIFRIGTKYILYREDKLFPEDCTVYDDFDRALEDLNMLEGSLYPSIADQIETVCKKLPEYRHRLRIFDFQEINNKKHRYGFNIELDGNAFLDNVYVLDAEKIEKEIKVYSDLKEKFRTEYRVNIFGINRRQLTSSKYYVLELEKGGEFLNKKIHVPDFLHGKTQKISGFVEKMDMDEVLERFEEMDIKY